MVLSFSVTLILAATTELQAKHRPFSPVPPRESWIAVAAWEFPSAALGGSSVFGRLENELLGSKGDSLAY